MKETFPTIWSTLMMLRHYAFDLFPCWHRRPCHVRGKSGFPPWLKKPDRRPLGPGSLLIVPEQLECIGNWCKPIFKWGRDHCEMGKRSWGRDQKKLWYVRTRTQISRDGHTNLPPISQTVGDFRPCVDGTSLKAVEWATVKATCPVFGCREFIMTTPLQECRNFDLFMEEEEQMSKWANLGTSYPEACDTPLGQRQRLKGRSTPTSQRSQRAQWAWKGLCFNLAHAANHSLRSSIQLCMEEGHENAH